MVQAKRGGDPCAALTERSRKGMHDHPRQAADQSAVDADILQIATELQFHLADQCLRIPIADNARHEVTDPRSVRHQQLR